MEITQEEINEILASTPNVYLLIKQLRRRATLYLILLIIAVAGCAFLFWAWQDGIKIAQACIASI